MKVAKDVPVTAEIKALVTQARRAAEAVQRHEIKMREASKQRRDAIAELTERGVSARQIAALLNISESAVYLARHRRKKGEANT